MITNHLSLFAAFDLAVVYFFLGGGIGGALFLFIIVKTVGNILFTDDKARG